MLLLQKPLDFVLFVQLGSSPRQWPPCEYNLSTRLVFPSKSTTATFVPCYDMSTDFKQQPE